MNKKIYNIYVMAGIIILVILAAAYYYYWGAPGILNFWKQTPVAAPVAGPKTHYVEITDAGLKPAALEIKSGDTVKFHNSGTNSHWPVSEAPQGPMMCPGFDPQHSLIHNESWSYKFAYPAPRVCLYKDRLDPTSGIFMGSIQITQ